MRRHFLLSALSATLAAALPGLSLAQAYPSKPVKIIVAATPGGTGDIFARAIAIKLQEALGQSVIVEYKPGAGTNIASDFVAKSAPDGHTILINGLPLAANPALYANMPFSPSKDLTPIIEVAELINVVTVHPSIPVKSMAELVQLAKKEPGRLNYGSPGAGSSNHLAAELLGVKTGAKFTHVAYQGNAQATTDHIGGTLQIGL